jgi:hypothetical protein
LHNAGATCDQAAQTLCRLVWLPDLGQIPSCMQPGEYRCVNTVSLDLGVSDYPHLQGIGDDHFPNVGLK